MRIKLHFNQKFLENGFESSLVSINDIDFVATAAEENHSLCPSLSLSLTLSVSFYL